jgi:hypothetical protein
MRRKLIYVACTVAAVLVLTLVGQAAAQEPLVRPPWAAIFGPDGTVLNLQGGVDAFFMEDKTSDGIGIDMTVIVPAVKPTVDNGVVGSANDLGNGYVWATTDAGGNFQIFAGVERLDSPADTYVEFEFNQGVVQVRSGRPWPIYGGPTPGDILVRVNLAGGALASAAFMRWDGTSYQPVAVAGPDGYGGPDYMVCVGAPPLAPTAHQTWDAAGDSVQVLQPNSFLEVGLRVGTAEFTSIQVRTAEDMILDGFRTIGYWAHPPQEGGQQ